MKRRFPRKLVTLSLRAAATIVVALLAGLAYLLGPALYHRFYLFPRQHAAIERLREKRRAVPPLAGWRELRAACHVHTRLSHDSEGQVDEIAEAARRAGVDVVLLADHPRDGKADFALQPTGIHDGVRFVPGFEMPQGLMPWGVRGGAVLSAKQPAVALARSIHDLGGTLFLAHIEQQRQWDLPELNGLEIYNIHADFKGMPMHRIIPELVLSSASYPAEVLRLVFDRPVENLRTWDRLSSDRLLAGIAGIDAHRNSGMRGLYTSGDTFKLSTTAPDDVGWEWKLNGLTRSLLTLPFGRLRPDQPLFRYEADRYETMMRFVGTHLWVRDETEEALLEAMRRGHAFIAFDHLADARGFRLWAESPGGAGSRRAIAGEALAWGPGVTLRARSPMPCRFSLVRDGRVVARQEGYAWDTQADRPGRYRLEAELRLLGDWAPWVYTNAVLLQEEGGR